MYNKSKGKGLAFKNGVIYAADSGTPDEEILTFAQIKGMIVPGQLQSVADEFAINNRELNLKVTEDNYLEILEEYFDSAEIRGSIIYMMTFADGDVAIRCVGYKTGEEI